MVEEQISEDTFRYVLFNGKDFPDGMGVVWREAKSIRLTILLRPTPFKGAKLVKTVYRIKPNEVAK